jgi:hypothetical protein
MGADIHIIALKCRFRIGKQPHATDGFAQAVLGAEGPELLNDFDAYAAIFANKTPRPFPKPPFRPPWDR